MILRGGLMFPFLVNRGPYLHCLSTIFEIARCKVRHASRKPGDHLADARLSCSGFGGAQRTRTLARSSSTMPVASVMSRIG